MTDRLQDQMKVIDKIVEIANAENVDAIFVLGDTFDKSRVDPITLRRAMNAILYLANEHPVYILAGNHEAASKVNVGSYVPEVFKELSDITKVSYMTDGDLCTIGNVRFWALPWYPLSEYCGEHLVALRAVRDGFKSKEKKTDVLLTHQSVVGSVHAGWVCDDGIKSAELEDGWDYVFAGHFHDSQSFGKRGEYVGAPMQHHFGDAGSERGVLIVDFKDRIKKTRTAIKVEQYIIRSPQFHILDWGNKGAVEIAMDAIEGDRIRIDIECTAAELAEQSDALKQYVDHWREHGVVATVRHKPVYHHEDRLELDGPVTSEEVISKYIGLSNTDGLDEKRLSDIGLGALNEVSDG
jgi:predicted phosphodiesterase